MSRILRRPMFRGGRVESKGDLKVVDQMGIAKLANGGMAQRPGYKYGQIVMDEYENINESQNDSSCPELPQSWCNIDLCKENDMFMMKSMGKNKM